MNVLMLCGSPHDEGGNSTYLLNGLKEIMGVEAKIYNTMKSPEIAESMFVQTIKNNGSIILSFPLYADSLPAYFLAFMQRLEKAAAGIVSQSKVYVIVNNGFYDAIQNYIAIRVVSKWCDKCGLTMGRALAVGSGGMAQAAPIGKGPFANLGKAMENLAESIKNGETGETIFVQPSFPRFMYKVMGNMSFTAEGKKNGLSKSEMRRALK